MAQQPPPYGPGWLRWRISKGLARVGLLTVAGTALAAVAASKRRQAALSLPDGGFIIELDLEQQGVAEHVGPKGLQTLLMQQGRTPLQLSKVVEALRSAGGDERVKGLLTLIGSHQMGVAQVQVCADRLRSWMCVLTRKTWLLPLPIAPACSSGL